MKTLNIFKDSKYVKTSNERVREATRGIFLEGTKILMIYCARYDDYSIPGGGIEEGESKEEALLRELEEEAGAINITKTNEIGKILEYREVQRNGESFFQTSYIYHCETKDFVEPKYEDYEIKYGYETKWVELDFAIKHNIKRKETVSKENRSLTALERELEILNYIKKELIKV